MCVSVDKSRNSALETLKRVVIAVLNFFNFDISYFNFDIFVFDLFNFDFFNFDFFNFDFFDFDFFNFEIKSCILKIGKI